MFSIDRKIYFYIGEMKRYISKPEFVYKEFLIKVLMKKGKKNYYTFCYALVTSYSSNKPGFINRNINRGLDGNRLKGGFKK